MNPQPQSATLYFSEGRSDKIYQCSLHASGEGWMVEFAYGKRGQSLKTGTKTQTPVAFAQAHQIFEKLVKEKTAKGYTPEESGGAYTSSAYAGRTSGFTPQLPVAIEDDELVLFLENDRYGLQEKRDGENRTIRTSALGVEGINRKGLYVDIPQMWADTFRVLGDALICGEACGETFYAFDLIELRGQDLRELPYESRYLRLMHLAGERALQLDHFEVIPMQVSPMSKSVLLAMLKDAHAEGVVFKDLRAAFEPGKGLASRKHKFVESASCMVLRCNAQRSVAVGVFDDNGATVELGNVTIPANRDVPAPGDIVEVQYLYRYEDGALEQPVYLGRRTDLDRDDVRVSQFRRIKRKSTST